MFCGTDIIPHNISGYSRYLVWVWEIFLWNIVSPTYYCYGSQYCHEVYVSKKIALWGSQGNIVGALGSHQTHRDTRMDVDGIWMKMPHKEPDVLAYIQVCEETSATVNLLGVQLRRMTTKAHKLHPWFTLIFILFNMTKVLSVCFEVPYFPPPWGVYLTSFRLKLNSAIANKKHVFTSLTPIPTVSLYEPYGRKLESQINQSLLNNWFCGYKWSKIETNFEQ